MMEIAVDEDLVTLVEPFLAHVREAIAAAQTTLERGELDDVRRLAHDLLGTGASLGFDGISTLGQALRGAAIAGDRAAARKLLEDVGAYLSAVVVVPRALD